MFLRRIVCILAVSFLVGTYAPRGRKNRTRRDAKPQQVVAIGQNGVMAVDPSSLGNARRGMNLMDDSGNIIPMTSAKQAQFQAAQKIVRRQHAIAANDIEFKMMPSRSGGEVVAATAIDKQANTKIVGYVEEKKILEITIQVSFLQESCKSHNLVHFNN